MKLFNLPIQLRHTTPTFLLQRNVPAIFKILLLYVAAQLSPCGEEPASTNITEYQTYKNSGLVMRHPPHWVMEFDDAPDFSNDRTVIFEPSELSRVTVFIYQDKKTDYSIIANEYVISLQLTNSSSI